MSNDNHQENLKLWSKVCKTAPSYTKHVNQRGGFTAIDPTYQAQKATEMFGPFGIGWGFESSELDFSILESTGMAIHRAVFFYEQNGKRGTFPIHNAIKVATGFGDKSRADEDFAKKVETNTLSKALSRLGFSADVFLGLFDDTGYVEQAKTREAIEQADSAEQAQINERQKLLDWAENEIKAYSMVHNLSALGLVHRGHLGKIERQCAAIGMKPDKIRKRFEQEYEARKAALITKQATGETK